MYPPSISASGTAVVSLPTSTTVMLSGIVSLDGGGGSANCAPEGRREPARIARIRIELVAAIVAVVVIAVRGWVFSCNGLNPNFFFCSLVVACSSPDCNDEFKQML